MGFRVEMREAAEVVQRYRRAADRVQDQLDEARGSFGRVVGSGAFRGQTGEAIVDGINNNHGAVLVALRDAYDLLGLAYSKTMADFREVVGENDTGAVIDSEAVAELKRSLSGFGADKDGFDQRFRQVYNRVDDLVGLAMPPDGFGVRRAEADRCLSELVDRVGRFEAGDSTGDFDGLLGKAVSRIRVLEGVVGFSFSDSRSLRVGRDASFADHVEVAHRGMVDREEEVLRRLAEEWRRQHPVESALDGELTDEQMRDFLGFLNDVGSGISWVAQSSFWGHLGDNALSEVPYILLEAGVEGSKLYGQWRVGAFDNAYKLARQQGVRAVDAFSLGKQLEYRNGFLNDHFRGKGSSGKTGFNSLRDGYKAARSQGLSAGQAYGMAKEFKPVGAAPPLSAAKVFSVVGKFGSAVGWAGVGFNVWEDVSGDLAKGKGEEHATAHGIATAGVGGTAVWLGGLVATTLAVSNPVGWAVLGGIGVGAVVSIVGGAIVDSKFE